VQNSDFLGKEGLMGKAVDVPMQYDLNVWVDSVGD